MLVNSQNASSATGGWEFQYLRCRLKEKDQVGAMGENISAIITKVPMGHLCGDIQREAE